MTRRESCAKFAKRWRGAVVYIILAVVITIVIRGFEAETKRSNRESSDRVYAICLSQRDGRQTLRDLVVFVLSPQPNDPPRTPEETASLADFEARALARIPLPVCKKP